MKSSRIPIIIAVVLAVIFVWYDTRKNGEITDSFAALKKQRDTLSRQVTDLRSHIAELERSPAPAVAITAPTVPAPVIPSPAVPVAVAPGPGVTTTAPTAWTLNGNTQAYVAGIDQNQAYEGQPSAYIKATQPVPNGYGGLTQTISAEDYAGKRVRYSVWVKTQDATDGGGQLWTTVFGQQPGSILAVDTTTGNRAVRGTSDWKQVSIVLDVPAEAKSVNFGFQLAGSGQMWTNGVKLEEVGPETPITIPPARGSTRSLPKAPQNINFN